MADKNMGSADFRGSDSEDDELAALREAALRSKKSRLPNSRPSSDSEPLHVPSMPVLSIPVQPVPVLSLPPPSIPVQSLPVAPLVAFPPASHFQRHPFKVQDKERFMRNGSQNFVRAPRSNLIVIQTVPLDEEKSTEPKRPEAASSQEKITLIRPQDKWAPTSAVKTASPAKPKVPTKFDRYEESESDTDEEDVSVTDDSESEFIFSREKHSVSIDEPEKGAVTPDADQLPCRSPSPTDAFSKQEDDPDSLKIEPDVDMNLANLNSASDEQLCEQLTVKSDSRPEDVPCASLEEPLSQQQQQQHDSQSSRSSRSSDFRAKEKIQANSGSRTQLKSPVSSMSPVSSGSLSRSSSIFTPCFDKKDERLVSQASPARQSLRTAFLDQSTSLISSRSSFSSSPWSHRDRPSPPLRRGSKGRSHSRDSSLRSNGRSASFGSPVSSRSRSRPRSPVGLKSSPRRLKSTSPSWSSTPLGSPLRNRSKTRSRSPPKTKKHSRSPVNCFTRSLSSSSSEHSSSRFRSKNSSGLDAGKHLNSRSQKPVLPHGPGSAFHHSNSPTLVRSRESEKSPQRTSYGHIRPKDAPRSPGYTMDEKLSPRLMAKAGALVSCRSSRRSRSPLKFRTQDSSWPLKQSRYSGRGSAYRRSKSPSPKKSTSGNSPSLDFGRYKSSPMRLPRSQSPWKRFSGSRSPPSRLARSRSPLSRFSRSGSPPIRRSRSRSPSVPRSFSPGMPQVYKPPGISKSRNSDSSRSYRDSRRLRHSPADVWRSDDVGPTFDDFDAYRSRFRNEFRGYSDPKELHRHEHYFEKKPDSRLDSAKALGSQSGRKSDSLRYDTQMGLGDKQRPKDVRPKEQTSLPKSGRDAKQEDVSDRQKPKRELLKGKNCEQRDNQGHENLSTNKTFADEKNLTRVDSARPGNDPSCVKSDHKDYNRLTKESEQTASEKLSVRTSIDSEIPLTRHRFSIGDDSDSEPETADHRQKHYIERKDLDTRDPVLQKRNDKQLRNSRFTSDKRQKGHNYNRFIREESGTRQDYIPPLMEGMQFRNAAPSGPSPRHPVKRPRSRSPPVKSVLSMVKVAKDLDSTEAEAKKSKPSSQLPVEKSKASSQMLKRNYVSDKIKDSPDVLTVGSAKSSSRGRRPKARTGEQTAHDKGGQVEKVGDQRLIQITFNQKMNFDGVNSTRPSVHERLGNLDVTATGKEKKAVDKSGSSLAVSEEKKFADLRDLIGDKSRHMAYDLDGGDGNNSGQGEGNNDLYVRHKAKSIRRRRKFNNSSAGNLEARQLGRAQYR